MMSDNDIEKLKEAIRTELSEEHLNFDRLGELTDALVHTDDSFLRFSVDAKHVHRLGFELVGKQETAVSELIKNAYDADATLVSVTFSGYDDPGGQLIIEDDGHGMSEEAIRTTWMCLSTGDKESNPQSPQFRRKRAGKKGIGRFAVERLGEQLVLETAVEGADAGLRVTFDWDDLYKHGSSLARVPNRLERFSKKLEDHGTKLVINHLRDRWTDSRFDRIWKTVLLLQPPFQVKKTSSGAAGRKIEDPGFSVSINGRLGETVSKELSIEKGFLDHRLAVIKCKVDENSRALYSVTSKHLSLDDVQADDSQLFDLIGPLEFEVSYFIYDSSVLSGISINLAKKIGGKFGGIRIYRDGFRVLPYGEPHDDWLRLGYDTGRRNLIVPANNNNFFGHVDVSSAENVLFEETSSREGLIENEAYEQLQELVRNCVEWAAKRIASARKRKTDASEKNFVSEVRKPSESTQDLLNMLEKSTDSPEDSSSSATQIIEALEDKRKEEKLFEEIVNRREKEHAKYEEMLRILASLGISIAVFSHEVRGALTRVKAATTSLNLLFNDKKWVDDEVEEALGNSNEAISGLFEISQYIVDLMDQSKSREKRAIPLFAAIDTFSRHFRDYLDAKGISFEIDVNPKNLRTEPMHPSEVDSVLFNFLTNAVKSMERANSSERRIRIEAIRDEDNAVLTFQDTGDGIAKEVEERVFDAFFTTSHYKADAIAGPGAGLGLKIVSDIASANGGDVSLGEPDDGYACKFQFTVPLLEAQRKNK